MKKISLALMIILYVTAGINHFIHPGMFLEIMPHWLPWHQSLVYLSGFCEIAFALLLIPLITRVIAAWFLIALLICVFPANIQMSINYYQSHHAQFWFSIVRLPLQLVLIGWAYFFTRPVKKIPG
jgi:uncharacterized membrane protein